MIYALYIASAIGAIGLLLMMPPRGVGSRRIGGALAAMTLGCLWLALWRNLPQTSVGLGMEHSVFAYYYVFSGLALVSAVRVITHTKPVYSALWFVMVVLSTAGLLLVLGAQFMAFAMVIIYGGAILVTYVFVIMLAAQSGSGSEGEDSPFYDRVAREPVVAVAAGFLLLAMLLSVAFEPMGAKNAVASGAGGGADALGVKAIDIGGADQTNVQSVGLDLFQHHMLGLELAGVILLISLVGAVVIARQRAEGEHPGPLSDVESSSRI